MRIIIKVIVLVILGLFSAIILYPFIHEAGHYIATVICGGEIYEVNILHDPHILCKMKLSDGVILFVGLSGTVLPVMVSNVYIPEHFILWYLWLNVKFISVFSLVYSLCSIVLFEKKYIIFERDDISQILNLIPHTKVICLVVIILFLFISCYKIRLSAYVKKCREYFN